MKARSFMRVQFLSAHAAAKVVEKAGVADRHAQFDGYFIETPDPLVHFHSAGDGRNERQRRGASSAIHVHGKLQVVFVAAFGIPEVVRHINAFTLGAEVTHPGAKVKVVWTNAWVSPQKETAA